MRYRLSLATILLAISFSTQAAPIYSFNSTDFASDLASIGNDNPNGGNILTLDTSYDEGTGDFTWNYTTDTAGHNGFWLVVSDGENPKYERGEYAILYGDTAAGTVSAFEYSGQNNANSFSAPGVLLETFKNVLTTSTDSNTNITSVNVALNTTGINSYYTTANWDGVSFSDSLGVWFHPARNANFAYDALTGELTNFDLRNGGSAGYYDTENDSGFNTNKVPEPALLALLLAGGFGFVAASKKQKKNIYLVAALVRVFFQWQTIFEKVGCALQDSANRQTLPRLGLPLLLANNN